MARTAARFRSTAGQMFGHRQIKRGRLPSGSIVTHKWDKIKKQFIPGHGEFPFARNRHHRSDGLIQLLLDLADRVRRELTDFLCVGFDLPHHVGRLVANLLNALFHIGGNGNRLFARRVLTSVWTCVSIFSALGLLLEINAERDPDCENDDY